MKKVEDYRPDEIEFVAESNEVPQSSGQFETVDEAHKFMTDNFLFMTSKFTALRKMDEFEIDQLRAEYINELENNHPAIEKVLYDAVVALEDAKKAEKDAKEYVNASLNKIKSLAREVKEGTTEMNLDQAYTYELVFNGKRYYYTIMDGEIKLAGIREVPHHEQDDLISTAERNALSFIKMKKAVNG